MPRRLKIFLVLTFVCLLADQVTKTWARDSLPVHPAGCEVPDDVVAHRCFSRSVPVIDGFWNWQLSFNDGAAFSFLRGQRALLSVVGVLALGGLGWMARKAREDQRALVWGLGLIAGGALGNLLDRVRFGVVTDFVHWHIGSHDWPVFNVADVTLLMGVGLMFLDIIFEARRKQVEQRPVAP